MTRTTLLPFGAVVNSHLHATFKVDPATTTGLTFGFDAGIHSDNNVVTTIAAGTVALADDTVNIVSYTAGGVVAGAVGTQGENVLYRVTTVSSVITLIEDLRGALISPSQGASGLGNLGFDGAVQLKAPDHFWRFVGTPPFPGTSFEIFDYGEAVGSNKSETLSLIGTPTYIQAGPFTNQTEFDSVDYDGVTETHIFNNGDWGRGATSGTFFGWVRPDVAPSPEEGCWLSSMRTGNVEGLWLTVDNAVSTVSPAFNIETNTGGTDNGHHVTSTEIPFNTWTFLVWTHDGVASPLLYIDGVLESEGNMTRTFNGTGAAGDFFDTIGAGVLNSGGIAAKVAVATASNEFPGRLAHLGFIRNRVLNATEISNLFTNGQPYET